MGLYGPLFYIIKNESDITLHHNYDGGLTFSVSKKLDEAIYEYILLAIEEGKRQKKTREFKGVFGSL